MWLFLLIFSIVLILYIHLLFYWKVSNDIDIPHISLPSKDDLEAVANSRQPFLFEKDIQSIAGIALTGQDIDATITKADGTTFAVPHKAMLTAVKKNHYLSNKNERFISSSLLANKGFNALSDYLEPPMLFSQTNDLLYGNQGVTTPLTSSLNCRNYFICLDGSVELKLSPPKCSEILKANGNGNIDFWKEDSIKECDTILLKIHKGTIMHIPAYWWYSFRFPEFGCLLSITSITYMNAVAQIPFKVKKIEF